MKKFVKPLSLFLMVLGTLGLGVLHYYHLTFVGVLLLVPLGFILLGFLLFVVAVKMESKY